MVYFDAVNNKKIIDGYLLRKICITALVDRIKINKRNQMFLYMRLLDENNGGYDEKLRKFPIDIRNFMNAKFDKGDVCVFEGQIKTGIVFDNDVAKRMQDDKYKKKYINGLLKCTEITKAKTLDQKLLNGNLKDLVDEVYNIARNGDFEQTKPKMVERER